MALQLAWYKSRGSFTATYETALTRAFDKARTETIRTLTEDSRAWVLSMADPFASVRDHLFESFFRTKREGRIRRDSLFCTALFRLIRPYRVTRRLDVGSTGIYSGFG